MVKNKNTLDLDQIKMKKSSHITKKRGIENHGFSFNMQEGKILKN